MSTLADQGHVLLQIGVALLLLTSLEGFIIPRLRSPRMGLSVHTLSVFEALVLLAFGLIWPMLKLGATLAAVSLWLFVYSAIATLVPYVLAAVWGGGETTIVQAAKGYRGTPQQETIIRVVLYSAALPAIVSLALILWGLR